MSAWLLAALLATFGTLWYRRYLHRRPAPAPMGPRVAVIVPVRGASTRFQPFLRAIGQQRDLHYRLIFAVGSENDGAVPAIDALAATAGMPVRRVVAGPAQGCAQKVWNLRAALPLLEPGDAAVVFADADTAPPSDWLAQLVRPVLAGHAPVASAYCWMVPADTHPASRLAALLTASVATAARWHRWNLCWGGGTAVSRDALARLDLPHAWAGTVSDDLSLTRAARRAGLRIHAPLFALVPSPVRHDWRSLLEYGRRQFRILRLHAPRHWLCALLAGALPVLGAAMLPLLAPPAALGVVAAVLGLQQWRLLLRAAIARRVLPPEAAAAAVANLRRDRWGALVAAPLQTLLLLASLRGRSLRWAGFRYRLVARDRTEILAWPADAHPASPRPAPEQPSGARAGRPLVSG